MENSKPVRIAFVQRLLPQYRFGFYKALSNLNAPFHLTLFTPKGKDLATGIKTISPEELSTSTNNKFGWVDTKITCYNKEFILWQSGVLIPLLRKKFDILMMVNQMSHLFYWLIVFVCKIRGIKIVFWSHGLQGKETGFKLWLKRKFLSLPDVNLVYAHYSKDLLVESGINPDKIQIVYNSLDFTEQNRCYAEMLKENRLEVKKKLINNNFPVIIFLGRLMKEKKIDMIFKAAEILKKRGFYFNILIAGKGPELEMLQELSTNLGLNDLTQYLGRLEEPELVKYFYISDVSVSPGNTGLNCMHSLIYGVPVITHNDLRFQYPEVEVLRDNETGIFFRNNDVEDLANKIEYWLKNFSRDKIAEDLRTLVQHKYSPVVQAECVVEGISLVYKN